MIRRKDETPEPQASMSIFVNKEEVVSYFPNGKEKELTLPDGKHILQFKCSGTRSRPYVLNMDEMAGKILLVAIRKRSKLEQRLNWFTFPIYILIVLSDNWWLTGAAGVLLLLFLIWFIRKRQDLFLISEQPA